MVGGGFTVENKGKGGRVWRGGGGWAREIGTICPFGVLSPVL